MIAFKLPFLACTQVRATGRWQAPGEGAGELLRTRGSCLRPTERREGNAGRGEADDSIHRQ